MTSQVDAYPSQLTDAQPLRFVSAALLAAMLLSVQIMPSLLRYLGLDKSMALGTAVAVVIILAVFLATEATRYRASGQPSYDWTPFAFAAMCVMLTVPHVAVANDFQPTDFERYLKTLPLLFLLLAGGLAFARLLLGATDRQINWIVSLSFIVLCISVPFSLLEIQPRTSEVDYEKSIFPFTETSHWALAFAPVWLYHCVKSHGHRRSGWLLFGFALGLAMQSLTLLIACMVAAVACRRFLLVSVVGLVLALGVVPFELDYFTSRLDPSASDSNLSTLVYIQGWQMLVEAMTRSIGWGVGFEQLGVQGTNVSAADAIFMLASIDALNILDGGFVLAKLGAEFGVYGILLAVGFAIAAVRSVMALRRERERAVIVLARCVVVCFVVDMFVRGTGYFTGSTLFAVTALGILVRERKNLRSEAGGRVDSRAVPA